MNESTIAILAIHILVIYMISVGLGAIVAQGQGARYVNRIWIRILSRITAFFLNTTADLLRWSARSIRR
ncbi:MAG: hypothetical protein ACQESA_03300 [Patescibacteria group bacterium]